MAPTRRSARPPPSPITSPSSSCRPPTSPRSGTRTRCACSRASRPEHHHSDTGATRVIIDWHSHIYTPEEAADDLGTHDGKSGPKWGERGCPMVLENFLDAHYKNGIDISVVTNAAHYLRGKAKHEELPAVQKWSDYAADLQQKYKGTLYSFATILPCGGPAFIKETERAIRELGLKGIFIHSSHKGHYPDDDEARPFC